MLSTIFANLFLAAVALGAAVQEPFLGTDEPPHLPPFPFPRPKPATHTVYDLIHNNERYTKLNKAIKFVGDDFISVLNDTSHNITFFAVPDKALRPPDHEHHHDHKHKHHHKHHDRTLFDIALADSSSISVGLKALLSQGSTSLYDALEWIDEVEAANDDKDGPDHDRRKELLRQIVKAILEYHVIPFDAYDSSSLAHNTTWATNFVVPKILGGHGQRIRVSQHLEKVDRDKKKKKKKAKEEVVTRINLFSQIVEADAKTQNGYVHVVNHPILPPPSIFQELFLAQRFFSTFTSALQRVGLTDDLDVRYVKGEGDDHGHLEGSTAVTVFAPTNEAFDRLPIKLKLFLFSAFGQRVLKKLLEYHIVPNVVAHADVIFNQTAGTKVESNPPEDTQYSFGHGHDHHSRKPVSSVQAVFNSRFFNHTVAFSAEKFKVGHKHRMEWENQVFVNGHPVLMSDLVGLNGAVHAIDHLLCPCQPHSGSSENLGGNSWEDWEECVAEIVDTA